MFKIPTGMHDFLPGFPSDDLSPEDSVFFMQNFFDVQNSFSKACVDSNINLISTPMVETTNLFVRSAGETSDIVSKEMFSFLAPDDSELTLRPEGTAPTIRSAIENKLFFGENGSSRLVKLGYLSPAFRWERPQRGRFRQHTQVGVEIIGSKNYLSDIESLVVFLSVLEKFGITEDLFKKYFKIKVNYLGQREDIDKYSFFLKRFCKENFDKFSEDGQKRILSNPLRILDKGEPEDIVLLLEDDLTIGNVLSQPEVKNRDKILNTLVQLKIDFEFCDELIRGLDYYNGFVFEVEFNPQKIEFPPVTLSGGGRYDCLLPELDGPDIGATGFGIGLERLILVREILINLKQMNRTIPSKESLFIAAVSETERAKALELVRTIRSSGLFMLKWILRTKAWKVKWEELTI